jgi:hypothetical protein
MSAPEQTPATSEARIEALELSLIEQEHRLLALLKNVYQHGGPKRESADPQKWQARRRAAWLAVAHYFLSPQTAAVVTVPVIGLATLAVTLNANQLVDYQNGLAEIERSPAVYMYHRWDANVRDDRKWVVTSSWKIENTGQGPGVVKQLEWRHKGEGWRSLPESGLADDISKLLLDSCKAKFDCSLTRFNEDMVFAGYAIRADEDYEALLFELTLSEAPLCAEERAALENSGDPSAVHSNAIFDFAKALEVVEFRMCVCPLHPGRTRFSLWPSFQPVAVGAYQCRWVSTAKEGPGVADPPCGGEGSVSSSGDN